MRRQTAIRRLRTIAERCQRVRVMWAEEPFLVGVYAFGTVLEPVEELPAVDIALVLRMPAEELTWCAEPQSCAGLPGFLEIDKAPVRWYYRPEAWPVSNHVIHRPLRIWSLDGPDEDRLDALASGEAEPLREAAPADEELRRQAVLERDAALAHLRHVRAQYWEPGWRRENRGLGVYPENHLWNAVEGYVDLLDRAGRDGD